MVDVKICGVTRPDAVDVAVADGARYLGFVFFPKSPRHLAPGAAGALAAPARGRADIVAVTVDADDAMLSAIAASLSPDWIQAHGSETPQRVGQLRRFAGKGVIKAIGVAHPADFAAADAFAGAADLLLFDAKAPAGAALPGGNGAAFDWRMLNGRRFPRPWILSGGLTPDNIREAIAASGADAVDVSSGVESAPGVKDGFLIQRFIAAAKAA